MPELRRILVNESPEPWLLAGFSIDENHCSIGGIDISFGEATSGHGVKWELAGIDSTIASIDGIPTRQATDPSTVPYIGDISDSDIDDSKLTIHPNGVTRLDHVVVTTDNIQRTVESMEAAGFSVSRQQNVPQSANQQVFLWAGETILEVVGPVGPAKSSQGAEIWGLALTSSDLDEAARSLGDNISAPKAAVQPGRRIATIATKKIGIKMAIALMTPHISPPKTD